MLIIEYYEHTTDRNQLIVVTADNKGLTQLCERIAPYKLFVFIRHNEAPVSISDQWDAKPNSVALTITQNIFDEITAHCNTLLATDVPLKSYVQFSAGFSLCLYKAAKRLT